MFTKEYLAQLGMTKQAKADTAKALAYEQQILEQLRLNVVAKKQRYEKADARLAIALEQFDTGQMVTGRKT